MKKDDLKFEEWNPNFDDTSGVIWSAEWEAPEDKLEEEELKKEFMIMTVRGKDKFRWHYPEVLDSFNNGIDIILKNYNITDITEDDKEELKDFFGHWLWIVTMNSDFRPPMTFEMDDVEEEIGDDILEEIDAEYRTLGKESDLTNEIKRKYH